jgi:hypothetical protein
VRCGAVRCGAVRCGAVRCGAVRCGAVRCGAVCACVLFLLTGPHRCVVRGMAVKLKTEQAGQRLLFDERLTQTNLTAHRALTYFLSLVVLMAASVVVVVVTSTNSLGGLGCVTSCDPGHPNP